MSEFFFVVKTALFSALVLMVLQMKIGGTTLERHSEGWIYQSRVGGELQTVARGALRAGYEGFDWIKLQTKGKLSDVGSDETNRERSSRNRPREDEVE